MLQIKEIMELWLLGLLGEAPEVTLVSLKVGNEETSSYSASAVINDAIGYANDHGIQNFNYSLGIESHSRSLGAAIRAYDGLFIVSSGNEGRDTEIQPKFPAALNISNIITVGSLNQSVTVGKTHGTCFRRNASC